MINIIFDHKLIVLQGLWLVLLAVLMEHLSQPKVDRDACWVELEAMLEVLLGLRHLVGVGQLRCQMDAGAKVRLVVQEALLEEVD